MFISLYIFLIYFLSDYWLTLWLLALMTGYIFIKAPFYSPLFIENRRWLDNISLMLIYLRVWAMILILLSSTKFYIVKFQPIYFKSALLTMLIILVWSFIRENFIEFYIYFEASLLPIFFLVYGWGAQPERIEARWYLIFYTILGSLPLLICLTFINRCRIRLNFLFIRISSIRGGVYYRTLIIAFLIKLPIFLFHLWLPKVHVEAPLRGSMVLAAVLLKLGAFGLIRLRNLGDFYSPGLFVTALFGGGILSLGCLQQSDLKTLIAYSSVVHIRLLAGAFFRPSNFRAHGILILIIGHGLCSSCLFFLANLGYERIGSRRLLINKGLRLTMPFFSLWWFIFISINISAPFRISLFREILVITGILKWSIFSMLFLFTLSFLTSCYTIFMFSFSQLRHPVNNIFFNNRKSLEFLRIFIHFFPLALSILFLCVMRL